MIQSNLLTMAFLPLANGVFGFSTDVCGNNAANNERIITKNSNLWLEIIGLDVNNIQQVKTFTRIMIANNFWYYLCKFG